MQKRISILASILVVISLILLARPVNSTLLKVDLTDEDIYQSYLEGRRIVNGTNPYARILGQDMRVNQKYPTYFPLFYEMSFLSQKLGLSSYESWIGFWLPVFKGFDYMVALFLFAVLAFKKLEWAGVAAAAFWLFNRWTLYVVATANLDFIPIFFMLAALVLFPRHKWLAAFLFSISLALKQIGIFVAPLFVVWVFFAEENRWNGLKQAALSAAVLASVVIVSSLPFIFWNLEGFVNSVAFSMTRFPDTHTNLNVASLDAQLGWQGWPARIPMGILLLAIYWMAAKGIGKRFLPAVLVFTVFISFNAVLYSQYLAWLAALIPLLIVDYGHVPDNFSLKLWARDLFRT